MEQKSAFITIVGRPNVGKSTILNMLLGEKIAIISDKPQTTRTKITGVLTKDDTQLVFIDTPGMHRPRTRLSEHMVKTIKTSISDVDAAILVADASMKAGDIEKELIESFKKSKMPAVLALNKVDILPKKEQLLENIADYAALYEFESIVPLSALGGDGKDILLKEAMALAQPGVHFFPDDTLTDQPERVIVSEIVREKILCNMRDEIPHGVAVVIEQMKEREDKEIINIDAYIYCEKQSHKGMIIGKGGVMLKKIASEARASIEEFLDIHVNLTCWVKVKDDWRNSESLIKNFGLNNKE